MILNRIKECYDFADRVNKYEDIKAIVIHKTDLKNKTEANPNPIPDEMLTAIELCTRFKNAPEPHPKGLGTGGRIPYHFLIRKNENATIEQMLPLCARGAHCIGYNWRSVGVAVVGDFEQHLLLENQWKNLVKLCSILAVVNGGLDIIGHTQSGGTWDANKKCPGKYLQTWTLEVEVSKLLPERYREFDIEQQKKFIEYFGIVV
jgi:hypothetical protein